MMHTLRRFWQVAAPPKEDERGIYGLFFLGLVLALIVAVGIAIDAPRNLALSQRTETTAEEAARYAAILIGSGDTDIDGRVRAFILAQDAGATNNSGALVLVDWYCDIATGEIVVTVRGILRNTLSGLVFGVGRTVDAEARADVVLIGIGGTPEPINLCPLLLGETSETRA